MLSSSYFCPQCAAPVEPSAQECIRCQAIFPLPAIQSTASEQTLGDSSVPNEPERISYGIFVAALAGGAAFPIVDLLLPGGRGEGWGKLISAAAYFPPLFLLPLAAGTVVSSLAVLWLFPAGVWLYCKRKLTVKTAMVVSALIAPLSSFLYCSDIVLKGCGVMTAADWTRWILMHGTMHVCMIAGFFAVVRLRVDA